MKTWSFPIDSDAPKICNLVLRGFNGCVPKLRGITILRVRIVLWSCESAFVLVPDVDTVVLGLRAIVRPKLSIDAAHLLLYNDCGQSLIYESKAGLLPNCRLLEKEKT